MSRRGELGMVKIKKFKPNIGVVKAFGIERDKTYRQSPQKHLITSGRSREDIKAQTTMMGKGAKSMGAHSFPGKYEGTGGYVKDTPGLFTQSVDGMEGKHYVEKAVSAAIIKFSRHE
jgi:hypothetical protein